MNWTRLIANSVLFLAALFFGLIIVEIGYQCITYYKKTGGVDRQYLLFSDQDGGQVFNNINNFFVYESNKKIRKEAFFKIKNNWLEEYKYEIATNNLGLVQGVDIKKRIPSMLLLGDSFTEGQGAYPWFENFQSQLRSPGLQIINGGIMGTGFQQWGLLHDYLVNNEEINVKYLVVIFISQDYGRELWNVSQDSLKCISDYTKCKGGEALYGIPPFNVKLDYLDSLEKYRNADFELKTQQKKINSAKDFIKHYLPASTIVINHLRVKIRELDGWKDADNELESRVLFNDRKTIKRLIDRYGNNLLFVHIPQKEEAHNQTVFPVGVRIQDFILESGGNLYDGHKNCALKPSDYFSNDRHPNAVGYKKISQCVEFAVRQRWGQYSGEN